MAFLDSSPIERTARQSRVWTEGYDGETHYAEVLKALAPAFLILCAAALLMLALL